MKLTARFAVLVLCAVMLLSLALPPRGAVAGGGPEQSEWAGAFSPYGEFAAFVIRDAAGWRQLWTQLDQPPPRDFVAGRDMALAAFLGLRRTGGYDIVIEPAGMADGVVRYRLSEVPPAPGAMVIQVLTTPYRILLVPARAEPVHFLVRLHGAAAGERLYVPAGEEGP
jgi:hypothetical protein